MAGTRVERRLAAILAGDVAGYSRMMGADEEGTLLRLNTHRREFLEPKIAEHRGRIVKRTGDGVLIEFASAVDATRCAVEIQRGMTERNARLPQDKRVELRIGIHVGDIIIEDSDIFGDGVNIAARLEGVAQPGGICISEDAYRQVRGKLDATFHDAGEQQLKNIAQPVRIYQLQQGGSPTGIAGATLPQKPSIAVLPFQNMSDDPGQEYFADGIVEELITGLSRLRWLFVTRGHLPSNSRVSTLICARSQNDSTFAMSSRAACGRRARAYALPDSSSMQPPAHTSGPNGTMALWMISSIFRTRSRQTS
jgi:adenylate cyclase